MNEQELQTYLDKVKEHEQQQADKTQTVAHKKWTKNIAFVAGLNSGTLESTLDGYFQNYREQVTDSFFGGRVTYFSNGTTGPITPAVNKKMQDLFSEGISMFHYFGHSSAINLDYVIDDPATFKNQGKYPLFYLNGCDAGNIFSFDISRLNGITSLAEKFVMSPHSGAIAFIGSSHYGITSYLDILNRGFYSSLNKKGYGKAMSINLRDADQYLINYPADSMLRYLQAEQHILNGDPAVSIHAHQKPDYVIEEPDLKISPSIITVAQSDFEVKLYLHNIGKYTGDSVSVLVKRELPDGTQQNLFNKKIKAFAHSDSLTLQVPIMPGVAKGENKIIATIDDQQLVDELSETNNGVTKTFQIISNDLTPMFPYDLSVIPEAPKTFYASTSDPFLKETDFHIEIDTTKLFNSTAKYQSSLKARGGLVEFNVSMPFIDNRTYYWRVGTQNNGSMLWKEASFIVLPNKKGFNQSHYYQHLQSASAGLQLETDKVWRFGKKSNTLRARLAVFPTSSLVASEFSVMLNGEFLSRYFCLSRSVAVNILDPNSLKPLYNQAVPSVERQAAEGGFMGSAATCNTIRETNFEFSVNDATSRNKLKDFLNWIPAGYYVIVRNNNDPNSNFYVDEWKNDVNLFGSGNNLYDKLKFAGFSGLDNYTSNKVWVFVYKNGDNSFQPVQKFTEGVTDKATIDIELISSDSVGSVISPRIGPAVQWNAVEWSGTANSPYNKAEAKLHVYGTDKSGNTVLLTTVNAEKTADLSTISADAFPYLQLKLTSKDGKSFLPYQLSNWRVLYKPVPEGALAPSIKLEYKDTAEIGEKIKIGIPFRNISSEKFDSLSVKMIITDKNNQAHNIQLQKTRPLISTDTAYITAEIDTKDFAGSNTIYLDVNADKLHPEFSHANNFFYRNLFVKSDPGNPTMDVTFDGVHIMNNDIVSAQPKIRIDLKDEAKYLLLDDTSLVSVKLKYPDNSIRQIHYSNAGLQFHPAPGGGAANEAAIEFHPILSQDGDYELIVKAKDKSGNLAAAYDYTIAFKAMNKPMISDMFNYPNPFTTSTAFVFTLTGSQVPQNLRIQILTVTGKVVKEIGKEELGLLHIGTNITEYKWDGTDQFGQPLANGVYLYRIITNLNGNSLDRLQLKDGRGDNIDTQKFFNKGYGKMYLMR